MAQISILPKSKTERDRFDSEFYLPKYLTLIQNLKKIPQDELGKKCYVTSGSTPADRDNSLGEGIILLKTQNIREGFIDLTNSVSYIDELLDERLKSTRLKPQDILLNIVGATLDVIGRVGIVPKDFPRANITQAMALIRVTSKDLLPEYTFVFLRSKFGRLQVCRLARPTGQFNINLPEVRAILVPKMPIDFQGYISELVNHSLQLRETSKQIRSQAEAIILKTLKFDEMPHHFISNFNGSASECVRKNRIDPEYYQPKYDSILRLMHENSVEVKRLDDVFTFFKGCEVGSKAYSEKGIPFVRVSNVNETEIDFDNMQFISEALYDELKARCQPKNGELLITKDATAGVAYVVRDNAKMIISSGILRAKIKTSTNPDYLAIAINSPFIRLQMERDLTGSVIAHWRLDEIKNALMPIIDSAEEKKVGDLAKYANQVRDGAKQLLDKAINNVEIEIEKRIA
jgi:restriction endonuclease S subunit